MLFGMQSSLVRTRNSRRWRRYLRGVVVDRSPMALVTIRLNNIHSLDFRLTVGRLRVITALPFCYVLTDARIPLRNLM